MLIDAEESVKISIDLDSFFNFDGTINEDKSVEVKIDLKKKQSISFKGLATEISEDIKFTVKGLFEDDNKHEADLKFEYD